MKIGPYVEKLNGSGEYKKFTEEHPDAFMVAGFFVLDLEEGRNLHQIDYYVPGKNKIAAFTLDKEIKVQLLDMMDSKKVPEKLEVPTNIDLDALKGILQDEMKNRGMTEDIKKIIAVLQTLDGKRIWNLNCVLSGMEILKAHVEDSSKSVLKMEKASLMDLMKQVPGQGGAKMQQQQQPVEEGDVKEIKKLDELGEKIEAEKEKLKKAVK